MGEPIEYRLQEPVSADGHSGLPAYGHHSGAHPVHGWLLPALMSVINADLGPNKRILEIGCGSGYVANMLAAAGHHVVGVDPSDSGIRIAQSDYPDLEFYQRSTADNLRAEFGKFDCVFSLEVIEHVYSPAQYLRRASEALAAHGLLVLSTPYHGYFKNVALAASGKLDAHFTALWEGGHIKFWSPRTITELLQSGGFRDIRIQRLGRIPILAKSMLISARTRP